MGLRSPEISFTASATDAMHRAIAGRLTARPGTVVVSSVEHSAILRACDVLERSGTAVTVIGVDATGRVDAEAFATAVRSR